jgi:hypothetical protein
MQNVPLESFWLLAASHWQTAKPVKRPTTFGHCQQPAAKSLKL